MIRDQRIAASMLAWLILISWAATTSSAFVVTTALPSRHAEDATVALLVRKGQPAPTPSNKITSKRRNQLGIADDEDEYDLEKALENNTDPFISKLVAGSLILVLLGLLVVGVLIPSLTDYGEGVCSPIQTGGRC
jgi:hypothetical protein